MDLVHLARLDTFLRPPEQPQPRPAPPAADLPLAVRSRTLPEALARILDSRDQFMAAMRSSPGEPGELREEERYLAALRSARSVLAEQER
jgi:hypothetical protein